MSPEPRNPFAGHLAARGVVLLDGGLATALEAEGCVLDGELWSAKVLLEDPDRVRVVHEAYLRAGADCVTTATYQAGFEGLARRGIEGEAAEAVLRSSVRLARVACRTVSEREGPPPLVAASVGPYGAALADGSEYRGRYGVPRARLLDFHRHRFEVLARAGADVLACETIPDAEEAEVLLELLDGTPDAWAWMSFQCRDGRRIADGTPFRDVALACAGHERVAAVGVNCTRPEHVVELLGSVAGAVDTPLMAYPNSGETYDAVGKRWGPGGEGGRWEDRVGSWIAAGATIVGGCCRVGPDDIQRMAESLSPGRASGVEG